MQVFTLICYLSVTRYIVTSLAVIVKRQRLFSVWSGVCVVHALLSNRMEVAGEIYTRQLALSGRQVLRKKRCAAPLKSFTVSVSGGRRAKLWIDQQPQICRFFVRVRLPLDLKA